MALVKAFLMRLAVMVLEKVMFLWNAESEPEMPLSGFPITVVYANGEVELLPLEQEIKIGTDGMVYFKDKLKNKWMPCPEIVELIFTVRHE